MTGRSREAATGWALLRPLDAAYAILWLASDEPVFVKGAIVNTDGGSSVLPNARRG